MAAPKQIPRAIKPRFGMTNFSNREEFVIKEKGTETRFSPCLSASVVDFSVCPLVRKCRKQRRMHQRLKLPSESAVALSMAAFSTGEALLFLYMITAFIIMDSVPAVIESEVTTVRSKFTPPEKSMV